MKDRIEEFEIDGKPFVHIDMSMLESRAELGEVAKMVGDVVSKHPEGSLYIITNIAEFWLDSEAEAFFEQCIEHNVKYAKACAVTGIDGIKKLMVSSAAKRAGHSRIYFTFTKERAIECMLADD